MLLLWQRSSDKAGYLHAYLDGDARSVCKVKALGPATELVPRPDAGLACAHCVAGLLKRLPAKDLRDLPLAAFGRLATSPRAMAVLQALRPGADVLGDLAGLTAWDILNTKKCGRVTLELILEALRDTGVIPPVGGPARQGPAEARFAQQRRQPEEEQAKEFLDIVGARGIKGWTFQEIGDAMGITRGRAKQIIGGNPVLRALRSDSPQARVKEKLKALLELLQGGKSLCKATRQVGLTYATLNRYLGEDARRLDDDPDTRRLLERLAKLREALATVRRRIVAGVPCAEACEGLEPDPVVLRRHLERAAKRNPARRGGRATAGARRTAGLDERRP